MSQACELTGKKPMFGNKVSHSNTKTRTRWNLNLKEKNYTIDELGKSLRVRLSTRAIRTVDKLGGLGAAVLKAKEDTLSPVLLRVRRDIIKKRRKKSGFHKAQSQSVAQAKTTTPEVPQDQPVDMPQDKSLL